MQHVAAAGVDDNGALWHLHSNDDGAVEVIVPVQTSFTDTQVVDSDNDSDSREDETLVQYAGSDNGNANSVPMSSNACSISLFYICKTMVVLACSMT